MTFVNEEISKEDRKKYKINELDKKLLAGKSRYWTVDRERDIYLRTVKRGREEFSSYSTWHLFWCGELLVVKLQNISTSGPVGGDRHGHKKLCSIKIPEHLAEKENDILKDLYEALLAYKDGGTFATANSYKLTLDIEK